MIPTPPPVVSFPRKGPWSLGHGARPVAGGLALRVWAPGARSVDAVLGDGRRFPLEAGAFGDHQGLVAGARAGTRYGFSLDGGPARPDPASRFQPDGVHGLSEAVDPSFIWGDRGWRGVPLERAVIYEAHVGTFTPRGTYGAMAGKLAHLAALGVTLLELLPLSERPGRRNWGYDGAHHYAPHASYGRPEDLKRLVDACHRRGIGVCLDVVYNHLGPEGNYLGEFGPYFTGRYRTPWGPALNFDGPGSDGVRRWAIENALYWITEFHIDALRLDAVQTIHDSSPWPILAELKAAVGEQARRLGRRVLLVAETDANDSRVIRAPRDGGWGLDAQWADDFHHALHSRLTGERLGYYADYEGLADAARALREGYALSGRRSPFHGRRHGTPSADLPPRRFVFCLQNHDQVGNRPGGERLSVLAGLERQKACAALLLLAPQTPMLFMGEEWGERRPFYFFTEFGDRRVVAGVRHGRRREMREFGWSGSPPDPQDPGTLRRSVLDWGFAKRRDQAGVLALYRELLRLRRAHPALAGGRAGNVRHSADWLRFERRGGGRRLAVVANLGSEPVPMPPELRRTRRLLSTRERRFGGPGAPLGGPREAVPGGCAIVLG